ncbi:MAG: aminotransferase class I/II-fold pyridoxal phosphate-dependent enzyme [Bacteroidetes bacterium]|nr:aminotransferase class I/II-fold pyridoxal phosphate-dependent enzyme [Bacteroidota bacterium]
MDISYILNILGEDREEYYGAIAPPVIQSSNFAFPTVASLRGAFERETQAHLYTRGNNPTVEILRRKLAALAGADDALVLGSGAAAMATAVIASVKAGDHIICVRKPYSWTEKLCRIILKRFGVETTFVDGLTVESYTEAVKENTRLFILESPNTFTFELQDLRALAAFARQRGITTIIDNTYSTPIGQRCIEMGIDLEVHSASKYLNGHSDVIAGVIIGSHERIGAIYRSEFMNLGAIISPHDAWLMLRGLRTLPIRMRQTGETTEAVVAFLKGHPAVRSVLYAWDPDSPQIALARQQMTWNGGLFSIHLATEDISRIEKFCEALQFFKMAVSWGGHESLIMPACAFYPASYDGVRTYPPDLVRLYIGLESAEVLISDLKQALTCIV